MGNHSGKGATGSGSLVAPQGSLSEGRLLDNYVVGKELGRGTFSIVKEGTHKKSGQRVALKFVDKKYVDEEDLKLLSREIEIMKKVSHKNVLSLKEIYETPSQLSLVMELVTGGELFYKIVENGGYSERDAADIVRQICEGVKYLHSCGICHRDLKPENLLCSGEGSSMIIKIADFGLSKIFAGGQSLQTSCGTPDYAAPEVLTGGKEYDNSVDLWSIGVVTYVLLCGYPPFYGSSPPALFEKIIKCQYDFPHPEWTDISESAKDFVRSLLRLDPTQRLTAEQCLQHPFLKEGSSLEKKIAIQGSMANYMNKRKEERDVSKSLDSYPSH